MPRFDIGLQAWPALAAYVERVAARRAVRAAPAAAAASAPVPV